MNRQELKTQAKSTIDTLFGQLDRIERQSDKYSREMLESYTEKKMDLRKQQKDLEEKYWQLKNATEESFEEAGNAFNESKRTFQTAIENVSTIFDKVK